MAGKKIKAITKEQVKKSSMTIALQMKAGRLVYWAEKKP
jgi:hypothetical protein